MLAPPAALPSAQPRFRPHCPLRPRGCVGRDEPANAQSEPGGPPCTIAGPLWTSLATQASIHPGAPLRAHASALPLPPARHLRARPPDHFPVAVTRQIESLPSSVTRRAPSYATATPTGRPHTSPFADTKPDRKSS